MFLCKKHLAFDANWTEEHVCTSSWRAVQCTGKGAVDLRAGELILPEMWSDWGVPVRIFLGVCPSRLS